MYVGYNTILLNLIPLKQIQILHALQTLQQIKILLNQKF